MKRKRLNKVYMREVTKSVIKTIYNKDLNAYMTYKHVIDIIHPCTIKSYDKTITLLDKNYTIFEYSPINKLYNVRIFISDKDEIILYYFDMIEKSECIDNEIYYDDLYLDIVVFNNSNEISLVDEDDLKNALKQGEITKEEYDESYKVAYELIKELENENNIFVNRKINDYLKMKEE